MDEQRRQAEADKLAAITELEHRSREFMREKNEKRALEGKIAKLQSQMLVGGSSADVNPAIRCHAAERAAAPAGGARARQCAAAAAPHIERWQPPGFVSLGLTRALGCRHLLEGEHAKIRSEYENRFRDLERQRTAVEGDRAQVRRRGAHVAHPCVAPPQQQPGR